MKNQLLNSRFWCLGVISGIFILGLVFSLVKPNDAKAQQTVYTGTVYVYEDPNDTLSVIATDGVMKFYKMTSSGNLVLKAVATLENGEYVARVEGSGDLYVVVFPDDEIEDNFVASYYPGWLDFDSADPISEESTGQDTVAVDWGAVGKEIVERPANGQLSTVSGFVKTSDKVPFSSDIVPMAYLLSGEDVIASAPIGIDGKYTLTFFGNGTYEVLVSAPGFSSQSKYITQLNYTKGDFTVNFSLNVYRGEVETSPVNSVSENFTLNQNFPNPFNPTTSINFSLNVEGKVKLTVYNSVGKEVRSLINDLMEPGSYSIPFNASNLASGIYYYTLQVGNTVVTKKMNLVK